MPSRSIYRCSDGHLYTAEFFKALLLSVHLFPAGHLQRCPVDGHWRIAKRVNPNDLTDQEIREAEQHRF